MKLFLEYTQRVLKCVLEKLVCVDDEGCSCDSRPTYRRVDSHAVKDRSPEIPSSFFQVHLNKKL